ncbi:MAG: dienelactone hydrolase family protein [Planctomycetales bacterium]|nr:dienelactone hydrolase family protein [Planctomycetales bacterium]
MPPVDFREKLLDGLGGDWPAPCPLDAQIEDVQQADGFRIERVVYAVEPDERVASLLLVPDDIGTRPRPGVCVWHQHAGQWHLGKSEPAGLAGNPMHHTGAALAREGYVVLCPDAIGFEERETGRHKGGDLERFLFLRYVVAGKSMAWKNILDMRRAVDYLASRREVDPNRLGCYGHSMGSTHTWLVGPWEPRLQALVGNCCLPTYEGIDREELLHCFPNFIPGLYQYGDTPDIAALIAPRALLLNFGENDHGSPIDDARRGIETIRRAYEAQHAEDKFEAFVQPNVGHVLSPEMWQRVQAFFAKHLGAV